MLSDVTYLVCLKREREIQTSSCPSCAAATNSQRLCRGMDCLMSPLGIARDCKKNRSAIRDQCASPSGVSHLPRREGGLLARQYRDDAQQPIGIATAGQAPPAAKQSTDRDCILGWSGTGAPVDPLTAFALGTPPPASCSMHQGGALGPSANSGVSPFIVFERERLATHADVPQWPDSSSSAEYDGFDYSHVLHSLPTEVAAAGPSYAVLGGAPPGALSVSSGTAVHDAAAAAIPSCSLVSATPSVVWSGLGPLQQTSDGPCVYEGAFMGACVSIHTSTAQQQVGSSSIHWQRSLAATISRQVPLQRPQMSTRNSQAQLLQQQQQQVETPPLQQPPQQEQQEFSGYLGQLQQSLQSLSMLKQQQQAGPDEQRQNHKHCHHHHHQQQQHKEAGKTPQPPPQDCSASCNHGCTSDSSTAGECPPLSGGLPTAGVTAALAAAGATGTTALVALGAAAVDFAAAAALPGASQAGLATLVVAAAAVDGGGGSTSTGTRS